MDRRFLRPRWIVGHLMVLLAALVCLRLGWWQWNRSHDADGTIQNLGYAVLWPVFGGAFIYMWIRFLHLEQLKDDDEAAELRELLTPPVDGTEKLESVGHADPDSAARLPEQGGSPADSNSTAGRTSVSRDDFHQTDSHQPDFHRVDAANEAIVGADSRTDGPETAEAPLPRGQSPSRGVTISVAMIADEDSEDPELAAYNRALSVLAEKDHRRAR